MTGGNYSEKWDYLDGFQYRFFKYLGAREIPDIGLDFGSGEVIRQPKNEFELQFFPTAEGYYDALRQRYVYHYTDHLGNIRLSYYKSSNNLVIAKETNYYPFGLEHSGYNGLSGNQSYKYSFQGQERQDETGWLSFKWRNYMPDLGRFFNVDPLSEKYAYQSHYNFSENRVVDGRELEGLKWENFRSSFLQPRMLEVKSPSSNAQFQKYQIVIQDSKKSFSEFKTEFSQHPESFLSNSKASFNHPVDGTGKPDNLKKGNYIKIDINGPMNNSYVKIVDVNESENNMNAKFQTVQGHIEKGIILFNLTQYKDGKIGFTITSKSEVDMGVLNLTKKGENYAREQQKQSWQEVLGNINKFLGGKEVLKKTTIIKEDKK